MNRGSAPVSADTGAAMRRFNEAPIHESGKCQVPNAPATGSRCFNEAPIHESGKSCGCATSQYGSCIASMRPRFMNRGSAVVRNRAGLRELMLQ